MKESIYNEPVFRKYTIDITHDLILLVVNIEATNKLLLRN